MDWQGLRSFQWRMLMLLEKKDTTNSTFYLAEREEEIDFVLGTNNFSQFLRLRNQTCQFGLPDLGECVNQGVKENMFLEFLT